MFPRSFKRFAVNIGSGSVEFSARVFTLIFALIKLFGKSRETVNKVLAILSPYDITQEQVVVVYRLFEPGKTEDFNLTVFTPLNESIFLSYSDVRAAKYLGWEVGLVNNTTKWVEAIRKTRGTTYRGAVTLVDFLQALYN